MKKLRYNKLLFCVAWASTSCGKNTPAQVAINESLKPIMSDRNECGFKKKIELKFEPSVPAYSNLNDLGPDLILGSFANSVLNVLSSTGASSQITRGALPRVFARLNKEKLPEEVQDASYFRVSQKNVWKWNETSVQFGSLKENESEGFSFVTATEPSIVRNSSKSVIYSDDSQFVIVDEANLLIISQKQGLQVAKIPRIKSLADTILTLQAANDLGTLVTLNQDKIKTAKSNAKISFLTKMGRRFEIKCVTEIQNVYFDSPVGFLNEISEKSDILELAMIKKDGLYYASVDLKSGKINPAKAAPDPVTSSTQSKTSQTEKLEPAIWAKVQPIITRSCLTANCHARAGSTAISDEAQWKNKKEALKSQLKSKSMPSPGSNEAKAFDEDSRNYLLRYLE